MGIECAYSFRDLYFAAFRREPKPIELQDLYALPQTEKNLVVADWAKKASWVTVERLGSDEVAYLAFYPKNLS